MITLFGAGAAPSFIFCVRRDGAENGSFADRLMSQRIFLQTVI